LDDHYVFEETINGSPVVVQIRGTDIEAVIERVERRFAGLRECGNRCVSAPVPIDEFITTAPTPPKRSA